MAVVGAVIGCVVVVGVVIMDVAVVQRVQRVQRERELKLTLTLPLVEVGQGQHNSCLDIPLGRNFGYWVLINSNQVNFKLSVIFRYATTPLKSVHNYS